MNPTEEIDKYIASHPDWRGETLSEIRKTILAAEPGIVEEWKWMGSPVWEKDGIICVGNIFKNKVQIVFRDGAFLSDPDKVFNAGLDGKQWRTIDIFEGDHVAEGPLKTLVRSAIGYNQGKLKK
jgi:hypothetical protein